MIEIDCQWDRPGFRMRVRATLPAGVHGIFGPSGSGKTTLVNLLAGIDRPTDGRIAVDGLPLVDSATGAWVPPHIRRFATAFQEPSLFPHLTMRRNLAYGQPNPRSPEARCELERMAESLEIADLLDRSPRALSGGQARRVAIGRALLTQARLLILDEPFTGLDTALTLRVLDRLRDHFQATGTTAIIVSHDLPALQSLTDQLLILDRGRLIDYGHLDEMILRQHAIPLLRQGGMVNVIDGAVEDHDEVRGLTWVRARTAGDRTGPPERIAVPLCRSWPLGIPVVVGVRPQEIVLAGAPLDAISTQNHFRTQVTRIVDTMDRVLCQMPVLGGLWVELTRSAVHELGIQPGAAVWCLFKSSAIVPLSGGAETAAESGSTPAPYTRGDFDHAVNADRRDPVGQKR